MGESDLVAARDFGRLWLAVGVVYSSRHLRRDGVGRILDADSYDRVLHFVDFAARPKPADSHVE